MIIHEIEWFNEFECIGGDCPQTCCKGWLIPLDEEDLIRYREEKGRLGLSLFTATAAYTRTRINLCSGECRFHTGEGLCRLQLIKGHDYIPWACRSFPRFYRNYGEFEERYLDLSCIEAAKLFIKNADNIRIVKKEGEPETKPCATNDDTVYMRTLLSIREDMNDSLTQFRSGCITHAWNPKNIRKFGMLADSLYKYACTLQDMYAKGGEDADVPLFTESETGMGKTDTDKNSEKDSCFPLQPSLLREFTEAVLYYFGRKKTGPELYKLLTDAQAYISGCGRNADDFTKKTEALFAGNPSILSLFSEYLAYYLYQYFLETFETYSFRRIVALGIIHTNMLLLMLTVYEDRAKKAGKFRDTYSGFLSEYDIAYVIALYNRKAYYNETIQNELYRIFEESRNNE